MSRKLAVFTVLSLCLVLAIAPAAFAKGGKQKFTQTDEYKDGSYDKGIITDYSDMEEGDGVEWAWVAPGVNLSDYTIKLSPFKNVSEISSKKMVNVVEDNFKSAFEGEKGKKGTLTSENAIYWAERASEGKRWIPYAGYHLAQAGVGIEMILKDSSGKVVAKIRHSGREGNEIEDAADEVAGEVADFIKNH